MALAKCVINSLITIISVHLMAVEKHQGIVQADFNEDYFSPPYVANEQSDSEDFENSEPVYEPFDPEKSGYLLHEYYQNVYDKYPEYDVNTIKENLNYYGDILEYKNRKHVKRRVEENVGDEFILDPNEIALFDDISARRNLRDVDRLEKSEGAVDDGVD